jgi:hypothetical protein
MGDTGPECATVREVELLSYLTYVSTLAASSERVRRATSYRAGDSPVRPFGDYAVSIAFALSRRKRSALGRGQTGRNGGG